MNEKKNWSNIFLFPAAVTDWEGKMFSQERSPWTLLSVSRWAHMEVEGCTSSQSAFYWSDELVKNILIHQYILFNLWRLMAIKAISVFWANGKIIDINKMTHFLCWKTWSLFCGRKSFYWKFHFSQHTSETQTGEVIALNT